VCCPSQHAEHNELRNHTLNVKACLEGKGCLQALTPSLCSRPIAFFKINVSGLISLDHHDRLARANARAGHCHSGVVSLPGGRAGRALTFAHTRSCPHIRLSVYSIPTRTAGETSVVLVRLTARAASCTLRRKLPVPVHCCQRPESAPETFTGCKCGI
jgi:hypothetical protein